MPVASLMSMQVSFKQVPKGYPKKGMIYFHGTGETMHDNYRSRFVKFIEKERIIFGFSRKNETTSKLIGLEDVEAIIEVRNFFNSLTWNGKEKDVVLTAKKLDAILEKHPKDKNLPKAVELLKKELGLL